MTVRYARSTDGSNSDSGATWALAKLNISGVDAIDTAGDTIWLSQVHAESTTGTLTYTGAGTFASPQQMLCGNDAAEPPTSLATTATVTTTSGGDIHLRGSIYGYGISFISAGRLYINTTAGPGGMQRWELCNFTSTNTGSGGGIHAGSNGANALYRTELRHCGFKLGAANQGIRAWGDTRITGGSLLSGGTSPTNLFQFATDRTNSLLEVNGFDMSNLSASSNIFSADGVGASRGIIRNCKLPASWTGGLVASGVVGQGQRYEMYNCDNADTNYRLWTEDYSGSVKSETTIIRTGGASDGTTGLSWRLATSANAAYPLVQLESPEIVVWNDTSGSSKTVSVEIVHDSQGTGTGSRFKNDEIWLEVQYLGDGSFPITTLVSDAPSDVLAAAADQTDSTETWTTTGLTTPVKQKLSVTFTPQEKGFFIAKVVLAKASKVCYVCPKLTVA